MQCHRNLATALKTKFVEGYLSYRELKGQQCFLKNIRFLPNYLLQYFFYFDRATVESFIFLFYTFSFEYVLWFKSEME